MVFASEEYPLEFKTDTTPIVVHDWDFLSTKSVSMKNAGKTALLVPNVQTIRSFNSKWHFELGGTAPEMSGLNNFRLGADNPEDFIPSKNMIGVGFDVLPAPGYLLKPNDKIVFDGEFIFFLPPIGMEKFPFWNYVRNSDTKREISCFLEYHFDLSRYIKSSMLILNNRQEDMKVFGFRNDSDWPEECPSAVRLFELKKEGYTFPDKIVLKCPVTIIPRPQEEVDLIREWVLSGPLLTRAPFVSQGEYPYTPFIQNPIYMVGSPYLSTVGLPKDDLRKQRLEKRDEFIAFCDNLSVPNPETERRIAESKELEKKLLDLAAKSPDSISPALKEFIVFRGKLIDFRFGKTEADRKAAFDGLAEWLEKSAYCDEWLDRLKYTLNLMATWDTIADLYPKPEVEEYQKIIGEKFEKPKATTD